MKIVIVNTLYYPNEFGGAEKSIKLIAEKLAETGDEIVVLCNSNSDAVYTHNKVKIYFLKVNLYYLLDKRPTNQLVRVVKNLLEIFNFAYSKKIRKVLVEEKPDVIHTNNLGSFSVNFWRIARKMDIPVIHTIRDLNLICAKVSMFRNGKYCKNQCFRCKCISYLKKVNSNNVEIVVGNSKYILNEHLARGYFKNSTIRTHIYNGINLPNASEINKIKDGRVIVGIVSSILSESKGIFSILNILKSVQFDNIQFQFYGGFSSPEIENYLKMNYESEFIRFEGLKPIDFIFKTINILVIPSLTPEAFPRTLIEAFSYGIPVISTNRGGTVEMITHGVNGYIYDPEIENEFINYLMTLIKSNDLLFRMSLNAKKTSVYFDINHVVSEYRNLYNRLGKQ